jgi:ligand-binding sensor domain-containing protein
LDLNCTWALQEDNEGMIWMNDCEGRLGRYNRPTGKFFEDDFISKIFGTKHPEISDPPKFNFISRSKKGVLWLTSNYGLHRLNLIRQGKGKPAKVAFTFYTYKYANKSEWTHFYEDKEGMIWLSGSGLNRFNPKTGSFTRFINDPNNPNSIYSNNVTGIQEDKQGNLWVSTDHVLNKLNKERNSFTRHLHDPNNPASINGKYIFNIFLDNSNILWLATITGGLEKADLNQHKIAHYRNIPSNPRSLSDNKSAAICEDRFGIVWIGTIEGGLNAWNKRINQFIHYRHDPLKSNSLACNTISAVIEAKDGTLWVAGGKNSAAILSRFERETGSFKNYSFNFLFSNTV